jgi:hypothetical protein
MDTSQILAMLVSGGLSGGLVAGGLVWLVKSWLTERLNNSIRHEYDVRLESHRASLRSELDKQVETFKSQVKAQESVAQTKWEIKRNACLKALDIVDGHLANAQWSGTDANSNNLSSLAVEKQPRPGIKEIRNCYNCLALCCESETVLHEFKKCLGICGDVKAESLVDLRNAIRKELDFGAEVDLDRAAAFIARINPPRSL